MSVFIERQGTGSLKYDGVEAKFGATYPDIISMWIADMDVALPPAIQNTVNHYISSSAVGYQSVPVAPAVVRWLAKGGTYIEPEWVVPCNGVLSTIFLSVTLYSEPDSKVAVIAPTYSPLYDAVRDSGRNLQVVSTSQNEDGEWSLDITAIDPQSSMLLMCNPQNPTGHVWRPDQLAEIADAVGDKIEIILDGGVRRGTHVLKALSLGAKACSFGKGYLFALGAGGQKGIETILKKMKAEIYRDMMLMGCKSVSELNSSKIVFRK